MGSEGDLSQAHAQRGNALVLLGQANERPRQL